MAEPHNPPLAGGGSNIEFLRSVEAEKLHALMATAPGHKDYVHRLKAYLDAQAHVEKIKLLKH